MVICGWLGREEEVVVGEEARAISSSALIRPVNQLYSGRGSFGDSPLNKLARVHLPRLTEGQYINVQYVMIKQRHSLLLSSLEPSGSA